MKTKFIIIIGIVMMSTIPFATIIILDRYDNYLEQLEYDRLAIENQPKPGERSYIEPVLKAKLEKVELELRDKVKELHKDLPSSSYAVNLNHQTKEIEAIMENKELIPIVKEFATKYPEDIIIVVEYGKFAFDAFLEKFESDYIEHIEHGRIILHPIDTCASVDIHRITPHELSQYPATKTTKSGKTYEIKFLSINDDDLKGMPVISELISVMHKIPIPINEGISVSKGLKENPDWNYYRDWYNDKKAEQFNLDKVLVRGFVYNEEHYRMAFGIC